MGVTCELVQDAGSAHLDREDGPMTPTEVAAHAVGCPDCADHLAAMAGLDRALRMAPAPHVPDLSRQIVAAVETAGTIERDRQRRWVVALTGVVMVALSAGPLLGVAPIHALREVAMLELAIGIAVVLVAWRPRRTAPGLFPVVAVMSVLIAATALLDVSRGLTTLPAEAAHLPSIVAAVLLWHWARPAWRQVRPARVEAT